MADAWSRWGPVAPGLFPSESELRQFFGRLELVHTYFDHDAERHALQHREFERHFPVNPIEAPDEASVLVHDARPLPQRVNLPRAIATYLGVPPLAIDLDQLLALLGTRGLLVWHDGAIVHEQYLHDHGPGVRWMTNSASKLVVGMLVARAQADDVLGPASTPLTDYWPELIGTAWDGVTVGHCMEMTTGVDWVEESLDLVDADNVFAQLFRELSFGSIEALIPRLGRRSSPGTELVYSSIDTEALGGVLIRAVGTSIASYLQRSIWQPAGMEHDAYWVCDPTGRELALSGLCATLRDYARLGLVLLHDGAWNGQQVLPASFSERLANPDPVTFELPGHDDYPLTCWEQAFVPNSLDAQAGDYMAAGSYGQIIYVNPATRTVVAHQGIHRDITTEYIDLYRAFMAFRAISEHLAS